MRQLRRFHALSRSDKRLLLEVTLLLAIIRLGLTVCPLQRLRRALWWAATVKQPREGCSAAYEARVVWASAVAARRLLGDSPCLTQALTVQLLLMRRARPTTVHIGVARDERGELQAHAWVEDDGRILVGGSADAIQGYTRLAALAADGT